MLLDPVAQAGGEAGAGDLSGPVREHDPSEGRQADPFGQALAIDLAAQHPELDQPDQQIFAVVGREALAAEDSPVGASGELRAAEGLPLEFLIEAAPKGKAAHGPLGPDQRPLLLLAKAGLHQRERWGPFIVVIGWLLPPETLARVGRAQGSAVLLLASASPARRRLLEQAAIPHRVQVSGVDEEAIGHPDPAQLVQLLARAKAGAVLQSGLDREVSAVLGCDSVLAFDGEVFGKPADPQEAISRWRRMRGAWGELHTGHALLDPAGGERVAAVTTRVLFADLSDAEIEAYVATGEPLQCAGGFALEGRGGCLVERLDGCYSNVIGLSLPLLRQWLSAA